MYVAGRTSTPSPVGDLGVHVALGVKDEHPAPAAARCQSQGLVAPGLVLRAAGRQKPAPGLLREGDSGVFRFYEEKEGSSGDGGAEARNPPARVSGGRARGGPAGEGRGGGPEEDAPGRREGPGPGPGAPGAPTYTTERVRQSLSPEKRLILLFCCGKITTQRLAISCKRRLLAPRASQLGLVEGFLSLYNFFWYVEELELSSLLKFAS